MKNKAKELSSQDMLIREKGRKLLKELKEMGYDSSQVGKVFVRQSKGQSKEMQSSKEQQLKSIQEENQIDQLQGTDSLMSPSRQLLRLRMDIIKERSELRDLISKEREKLTKKEQNE